MAAREIATKTTHAIRVDGFHDTRDPTNIPLIAAGQDPTVFLDAATIRTVDITDISDPATPVVLLPQLTLVADGSGGGYGVDLVHDFSSSALTPNKRIKIVAILEEGAVHWETPEADQVHIII